MEQKSYLSINKDKDIKIINDYQHLIEEENRVML